MMHTKSLMTNVNLVSIKGSWQEMETFFFVLSENDGGNKYGLHTLRGKETLELEVGGSHLLSQICWRVGRTFEVPGTTPTSYKWSYSAL